MRKIFFQCDEKLTGVFISSETIISGGALTLFQTYFQFIGYVRNKNF